MDVEKNPRLDENFVTLMQNVDWRFPQIMQGVCTQICTHQQQDG